ncbi:MAG: InlB B-repeat-containing protein [Candidatus Natronoplasma sp.]
MKKIKEKNGIKLVILVIAVLLFGSVFSVWAVSTQESANVGVGDLYEVTIEGDEDLQRMLNSTTGSSGDVKQDKKLFDIIPDPDHPTDTITGSIHLYNAGEVEKHLNSLTIELKADEKVIGNISLVHGQTSFQISEENGWDRFTINTTGRGSYSRKPEADEFDLRFMVQIDEVQGGVVSEESIQAEMIELDISSTSGGSVTEPGEGTFEYEEGSVVDLEAAPNGDTSFVEWTGDNSTIDDTKSNQTTIEMLDNYTITAVFNVTTYDLTVDSTEGGSVTEPGEGTYIYEEGEIVDLEAVPDEGYEFVEWTGDNAMIDDTTANQTTIDMQDNYSITAEFTPITYELTLDSTSGGNVTDPGEGTFVYEHGTTVDLEAVVDDDSSFLEWSGDSSTIDDTSSNRTTIEILDNYSVTAVFDVPTYDLMVDSSEGGTVTEPGEGTYTYDSGETVQLEAVPDEGYEFVEWTGDNATIDDTTANQTTIEMQDNYSITAEFAPITYELTLSSTDGGNVTEPGEGTFVYEHGTTVDLEAVADDSHLFIEWTGDNATIDDTTANQTTIEMLGNYSITAEFLQEPFFDVQIGEYDDPVIEGQTATVNYNVTNTGDLQDTQDIEFTVTDENGDVVYSEIDQDVTLGSGDIYDGSFSWQTEEGDAGEYNLTVSSEDDQATVTTTVYATAMEINDTTATYTGDPAQWETHWEATDVYVEGLEQMDLIYYYELYGDEGTFNNVMAGVRILVNGDTVMQETTTGSSIEDWEGTADVSGQSYVDIQFQYYTETEDQGWETLQSEVTINQAGYEYVDTTSALAYRNIEPRDFLHNYESSTTEENQPLTRSYPHTESTIYTEKEFVAAQVLSLRKPTAVIREPSIIHGGEIRVLLRR